MFYDNKNLKSAYCLVKYLEINNQDDVASLFPHVKSIKGSFVKKDLPPFTKGVKRYTEIYEWTLTDKYDVEHSFYIGDIIIIEPSIRVIKEEIKDEALKQIIV